MERNGACMHLVVEASCEALSWMGFGDHMSAVFLGLKHRKSLVQFAQAML